MVAFQREKLQIIFQLQQEEQLLKKTKNEKVAASKFGNSNEQTAAHQNVLGQFLQTIADTTANAAVRVMQQAELPGRDSFGLNEDCHTAESMNIISPPCKKSKRNTNYNHLATVTNIIDRSMGVTGHALLHNKEIASNMALWNELRDGMGGRPNTFLHDHGETVASYHRRTGRDNSSSCSVRNNLKSTNELASAGIVDRAERVSKRLYEKHSCESNPTKKA